MNALIQSVLSTDNFDVRRVSEFTAAEVREAISALVTEDKTALADALCEAGLSLHPGDENILSMAALMANLHQDWSRSEQYLRELMDIQGANTTEFTWNMLVRVLRCQCEPLEALTIAKVGLSYYPSSSDLKRECADLQEQLGEISAFIGPVMQRQ